MKAVFLILLLASTATAYDYYFYNNENDLNDNVASALSNPYDGYNVNDVANFDKYQCLSLDDYNHYANQNQYDNMDPLNSKNIDGKFKDLRYEDQLKIINENPNDQWDANSVADENDMECWTLKDYNKYASEKPSDKWDEIHFQNFDDLEKVNEIGIRRFGFIQPDDLNDFNLQNTHPVFNDYEWN